MRKVLLSGAAAGALLAAAFAVPASAADLRAVPAPAPTYVAPVVPVFTWTGLYVGANAGAAWGDYGYDIFFPNPALFGSFASGRSGGTFIGGGQIGYNWQFNQFVFGLEGDIDGKSLKVTNAVPGAGAPFATLEGRARVEGSVRARGGLAFDRFLVYATGGWAIADVEVSAIGTGSAFCLAPCSDSRAVNGWTVGGGAEYALTNNVSLGVEYRSTDLGRETFNLAGNSIREEVREHQVTGRLNFKFGSLFGWP